MPTPFEFTLSSPSFSLLVTTFHSKTKIEMKVLNGIVKTRNLQKLNEVLGEHVPTIFESKCINKNGLTFEAEVADTQIGHLYEHMVLEFLCQIKVANGYNRAIYSGLTSWNLQAQDRGCFNISLNAGVTDWSYLVYSIRKASFLLNKIFFLQTFSPRLFHSN